MTNPTDTRVVPEPWPPIKKAIWDVLMGEKLNDGHYIKAFPLTDILFDAVMAAAPPAPVAAAQITMGRGLVDVAEIQHEGRKGILFRPRATYIPVGEPGELQEETYWPVTGDVVIWIENSDGAQGIQRYLAPFLSPPAPVAASPEAKPAPAVKALEWKSNPVGSGMGMQVAITAFETYVVAHENGRWYWSKTDRFKRKEPDEASARAAAQADNILRVRACLVDGDFT